MSQHYLPLSTAIPHWIGQASAARHAALKQARPVHTTAPAGQRAQLHQLNAAHWRAQNSVDAALNNLQDAKTFAKPLLEEALLSRFGLRLNSEDVHLRLYIPQTVPWFAIRSGGARTWTVSLLDAALHNFDQYETRSDAYEPDSTFITRPTNTGQFDTLPEVRKALSIQAFTRLCRELDIGARYARYLRTRLGMDEPVSSAVLQYKVGTSQKAALKAALQLASLQGDIQHDTRQLIETIVDTPNTAHTWQCHDLSLMDAPLTGIVLFAQDLEKSRTVQRLVAYVPDDPQHPFKEYASPLAFKQELVRQLRSDDYQVFFSRFVAHEQRGQFFSGLGQRLAHVTWHRPQPGSGLPAWRKQPTQDPKLQFSATRITGDMWQHLYQQKLNKLLNDARTLAVSTASADRKARWALWDSFVNVASAILNVVVQVVAPFVPGLGELMLGYMAYQLLDEVFEGVVDWAEGEGREALGHLMGVAQTLVQLGAFAAGSTVGVTELRKALPADIVAFVDRFKPVKLANERPRYWKPDLAPYEQPFTVSSRTGLDEHGLYHAYGESLLPLNDKLYAVEKAPDSEHYRIKHPTRPDAFKPLVRQNGEGTWHTELEHPQQWDRPTLLQRLGHKAQALSQADRELALTLSGVTEGALRRMHVNSETVPPLLDDTLARLKIDRQLQQLIDNLRSDDPAVYHRIDPQDQLQLLTSYGNWPASKSLHFLNEQGQVTWSFGDLRKPTVRIQEDQLNNGDLLKTVLKALTPEEITVQFGERASDPQLSLERRATLLRKRLADSAVQHRAALFDSRYGPRQYTREPHAQQVMDSAPGLPASIARHVLTQATGEEQAILDQRKTPERLATLARTVLEELQLNRAYEGQHLQAYGTLDIDRLALKSLKLQPGWSAQVRLEARHLSVDAEVWNEVGPADAPILRTLVRTRAGRYVPHGPTGPLSGETDLYSAILSALPDLYRKALRIEIHQGAELKRRLRDHPLAREPLRVLLNPEPGEPATVETLHLLGNVDGYPHDAAPPAQPPTLQQRARALFPSFDDTEIQILIDHLHTQAGGADARLAAMDSEFRQLEQDLFAWQRNTPTHHPESGLLLTARQRRYDRQNRAHIAQRITQCWRRETATDDYYEDPTRDGQILRLELPVPGDMPRLNSDFNHVTLLAIVGGIGTRDVGTFVRHFPNLRHLEVRDIPLNEWPAQLHVLANLTTLNLDNCNITLTPASHAQLAALHRLRGLNLHGNPLGLVPRLDAMTDLLDLDLSDTGIDRLPSGLLNLPELETAFLSNNRIHELPETLFTLPPASSQRFDLSGNPLSRPTLERIKTYFRQHGTHWEADAPAIDRREAQALFPSLNNTDINHFIFSLPGDLEAGHIELARLAGELHTLKQELSQWSGEAQLPPLEHARRQALQQLLERTWRRETPQDTGVLHILTLHPPHTGELPALSARFNHIGYLNIEGNGGRLQLDAFLGSFPTLDILNIQNVQLGDIPPQVFGLPRLTHLGFSRCALELSATSQTALENMSRLQYLNLDENRLSRPLDFQRLPNLAFVSLSAMGLREVPQGLQAPARPMTLNLSHNRIQDLPEAFFTLPTAYSRGVNASDNPLSLQTLERIKTYCQRTGEFFNARPPGAEQGRTKQLYPSLVEREVDRFIFKLPGSIRDIPAQVTHLEAEYTQLETDLEQWALDAPERHPVLNIELDESTRAFEQLQRRNLKTLLEQAWRHESPEDEESLDEDLTHSLHLDTPVMGNLPELTARFEHVSRFELTGNGTTTGLDGTLRCFPGLQTLTVTRCSLGALPSALFTLPKLSGLELSRCAITLTTDTARSLSDLATLEFLDMSNNPLTHAPDVSGLHQLVSLHLRDARISRVPAGVFQLTELQTLDLSDNIITEIPADILEMLPTFHDDSDLSGNPLSTQSLGYLRTYYQRTGIEFQVPEAALDEAGNPLPTPLHRPEEE
ncbi:MAG: hypothetical protein GAK37_03203 [Pseudomonas sp.]|nr:MAG: hypothetical protein GAK37_03203 [Pseudomonas sp.]